jgi:hypothetical protein
VIFTQAGEILAVVGHVCGVSGDDGRLKAPRTRKICNVGGVG